MFAYEVGAGSCVQYCGDMYHTAGRSHYGHPDVVVLPMEEHDCVDSPVQMTVLDLWVDSDEFLWPRSRRQKPPRAVAMLKLLDRVPEKSRLFLMHERWDVTCELVE